MDAMGGSRCEQVARAPINLNNGGSRQVRGGYRGRGGGSVGAQGEAGRLLHRLGGP